MFSLRAIPFRFRFYLIFNRPSKKSNVLFGFAFSVLAIPEFYSEFGEMFVHEINAFGISRNTVNVYAMFPVGFFCFIQFFCPLFDYQFLHSSLLLLLSFEAFPLTNILETLNKCKPLQNRRSIDLQ